MIDVFDRVGYILKRYPRYSETFVVNEILAHEASGLAVEILALRPTVDTHFQDRIAQVQAPVTYFLSHGLKGSALWQAVETASEVWPNLWESLVIAQGEDPHDIYQALLIARAAYNRGITHFHAHFATSATSVARLASHFTGIPYTFTAHAKDIFHESVQPADLQRKLTDAKAVITVSDFNRDYFLTHYGQAAHSVQRIYNGLDLSRFPYNANLQRPPRIVAVGRLVEKKGFGDLISACRLLVDRGCQFSCQIIGTGELEAALQSQIEHLQLQAIVELIGPRPQQKISGYIQSAAVLAAPCVLGSDGNRDGLPTVLLEAMALGTPCVSTDVTGIPEVVRDRQTGLLVPQSDPAALATALEQLLSKGDLRLSLATAARALIEKEFDIHQNTVHLRSLFGYPTQTNTPAKPEQQEVEI